MIVRVVAAVLLVGAIIAVAPVCQAGVLYTFDGNITPYSGAPNGAHETFTYLAPALITADTIVQASALSSSSVSGTGYTATVVEIEFLVSSPGWGPNTPPRPVQITFIDNRANPNFYFASTAFDTPGTYTTISYPGANTGTLTVSTASVPEPSTLTLLVAGVAGLGVHRWRGRRDSGQTR